AASISEMARRGTKGCRAVPMLFGRARSPAGTETDVRFRTRSFARLPLRRLRSGCQRFGYKPRSAGEGGFPPAAARELGGEHVEGIQKMLRGYRPNQGAPVRRGSY